MLHPPRQRCRSGRINPSPSRHQPQVRSNQAKRITITRLHEVIRATAGGGTFCQYGFGLLARPSLESGSPARRVETRAPIGPSRCLEFLDMAAAFECARRHVGGTFGERAAPRGAAAVEFCSQPRRTRRATAADTGRPAETAGAEGTRRGDGHGRGSRGGRRGTMFCPCAAGCLSFSPLSVDARCPSVRRRKGGRAPPSAASPPPSLPPRSNAADATLRERPSRGSNSGGGPTPTKSGQTLISPNYRLDNAI